MKKCLTLLLLCLMLTGCGRQTASADLMQGIPAAEAVYTPPTEEAAKAIADFSQTLLQHAVTEQESVLLSPLSILNALAMTANGAQGDTLVQMEDLFGLSAQTLSRTLGDYQAMKQDVFTAANSVWIRNDPKLEIRDSFLQTNGKYFNAGVFRAPFDDTTLQEINGWVSRRTKERIPELLTELPEDSMLCLINAMTFDGAWEEPYRAYQARDGVFTRDNGTQQDITLMYGSDSVYLEDDCADGFMKFYEGGRFVFAALRPHDGVTLDEYLSTLRDGDLYRILSQGARRPVNTAIPKFEWNGRIPLNDTLSRMGMTLLFDEELADLGGIGSYGPLSLYVSDVTHAACIKVNETGTEAAASTAVLAIPESAPANPIQPKTVTLDKPFLYLIWDSVDRMPLFIGIMRDIP